MLIPRAASLVLATFLVSCADTVAPTPLRHAREPGNESGSGVEPSREVTLLIYGAGRTLEVYAQTPAGETRTLSSSIVGTTRDVPVGVPRDTTLQFLFAGEPAVGTYMLPAQSVEPMEFGGVPTLVHRVGDANGYTAGTPNLMIYNWPATAPAPTREIAQVDAATVTITEYVPPAAGRNDGVLRGTIDYVAEEWVRQWSPDGRSTLTNSGVRIRIRAVLDLRWGRETRHIGVTAAQ